MIGLCLLTSKPEPLWYDPSPDQNSKLNLLDPEVRKLLIKIYDGLILFYLKQ